MKRKRCSRCEEWKPIDQFYGRKTKQPMCIPCYKTTYNSDYRRLLREKELPIVYVEKSKTTA